MRASSYTIYVNLPGDQDEVLIMHGFTGANYKVSRKVAAYVRSLEDKHPHKPLFGEWRAEAPIAHSTEIPSEDTIRLLRNQGFLTRLSVEEEEQVFCRFVNKLHEASLHRSPDYIFMPTYDCNLRCGYCYQGYLRTNPLYRHTLKTMPVEIVDRIFKGFPHIERLHGIEDNGRERSRAIGLFGGEPLLAINRPAVERIIHNAFAIGNASFWAISNATELEAYEDLLSPELISSIQVTLDGPPAEHDKRRIYADGSGSFERIARNITMALDHGVKIGVRMNVDRNNLSQVPELAEVILSYRWDKYSNFGAYAAPIRKFGDNVDAATTMDSSELSQAMRDMEEEHPAMSLIQAPDVGSRSKAFRMFETAEAFAPELRESACSAHTGEYMFDAFASIYVCWEHVGDLNTRIGVIGEDGHLDVNTNLLTMWQSRTVASNPVCRRCRYALHCGGGCAASALATHGTIHSNFCDGFATQFRSAIAQGYLAHTNGSLVNISKTSRIGCGS